MRQQLIEELIDYKAFNEQELKDKELMIQLLKEEPAIFLRSNLSHHFTASAWVVNERKDKVLMAYHNLYDSWAWLGGHADGEEDLLHVALKEVQEESGLTHIKAISPSIFSIEILVVEGHMKKGSYVSSHLHLNVTYLIEASETEELQIKEDENSELKWFSLEEGIKASSEPWIRENIYRKLNEKLTHLS